MSITNYNYYLETARLPLEPPEYKIIDNQVVEISNLIVYSFVLSADVQVSHHIANEPLQEWYQSESGRWVIEHAVDKPEWHRVHDRLSDEFHYHVVARMSTKDQTFFKLKFQ
jgi:hypothetical protein